MLKKYFEWFDKLTTNGKPTFLMNLSVRPKPVEGVDMTVKEYFQNIDGTGVLSTADGAGAVNAAVFSKPHVLGDGTIGFVMRERLTHHNLQSNPRAAYLFLENGPGYRGVRFHLKKVQETADPSIIEPLMNRHLSPEEDRKKGPKYFVTFMIEKILPLSGSGKPKVTDDNDGTAEKGAPER